MHAPKTNRVVTLCLALTALLCAVPVLAHQQEGGHGAAEEGAMSPEQQAMMEAWMKAGTPGEPHQRLAEAAGTWKATVTSWMEPGAEPMVSEGTFERQMMLDGRVLAETFTGNFMGNPFEGHGMAGYDNVQGKYWSTWNDNMSTSLMVQWGEWDEEQQALVMQGEMADPTTGGMTETKTVLSWAEAGKEKMVMYELRDGEEVKTMEIVSVKQ